MGESLRHVQNSPALAQVTTTSLPALQKYTDANRAMVVEGNLDKAIPLFREAIALDTSFGSAYRALSVALRNRGVGRAEQISAIEKAYAHAGRMSHTERFLTRRDVLDAGASARRGQGDRRVRLGARRATRCSMPRSTTSASCTSAAVSSPRRKRSSADRFESSPSGLTPYGNLMSALTEQGKTASADSALGAQIAASGNNPRVAIGRASLLFVEGQYAATSALADSVARAAPADSDLARSRQAIDASVDMVGGRLVDALRLVNRNALDQTPSLRARAAFSASFDSALVDLVYRDSKSAALARIDAALRRTPLSTMAPLDRPYANLAQIYAFGGRPELARSALAEFERTASTMPAAAADAIRHNIASSLDMGEGKYLDAAHEAEAANVTACTTCLLPAIGQAYDLAGQRDSAIAVFTRYVESRAIQSRFDTDAFFLAGSYKRLGELWEAKGDKEKATRYYMKFIDLWKNADPDLQPKVTDVRKKLQRMSDIEGGRS